MICPGCRGRMSAEDFEPILFTDGLVDVTYMCEWCGTEAKRAIRTSTATVGWVEPSGRLRPSLAREGGRQRP